MIWVLTCRKQSSIAASTKIIQLANGGFIIGGIILGYMGDKKGRLTVLFGSIILIFHGQFCNRFCSDNRSICVCTFYCGNWFGRRTWCRHYIGISELTAKEQKRDWYFVGCRYWLIGAVFAYFTYKYTDRLAYYVIISVADWELLLLLLRISVLKAGCFKQVNNKMFQRGNFFMFFNNAETV